MCAHDLLYSVRCPTANGNYQDTTDCSRYWRCTANQPTNMPCPVNQLFDPRTFQCSSLITTVAGCTMPPGRNPSTTVTGSCKCLWINLKRKYDYDVWLLFFCVIVATCRIRITVRKNIYLHLNLLLVLKLVLH